MARVRRWLIERGGLLALLALALYVAIAPAHIVDGDNAEFATLGAAGGAAHPTGYPAYLLWLRATAWLFGGVPAHTAAIATAVLAAAQLVVLHAACRAWGARPAAASLAVAIYAAGPVVLRYSSEAEVFALNQLVVAAVVYLAAEAGPLRGGWRVAALGLVAGLGVADHLTCVLAAPVGVLGAVRGVREARLRGAAAAAGVAALIAGVTPYLYLLVTPDNAISWAAPDGLAALVDHVLRRAYGGPGAFSSRGDALHPVANLCAFAATLGRAWWWLPGLAGLAVLGTCCRRPGVREAMWGWRMLALAFVLAGPVLAMRFDIEPSGLSLYVARRFHLMATLLLALPVAHAFDRSIARYGLPLHGAAGAGAAALCFVVTALIALPGLSRVRTPAVEHAMAGLLRGAPPDAVVLVSGDITFLGTGYLQVARGERRDVIVVLWPFVAVRWYRDRLARRGLVIDTTQGAAPSVRIAEQILASGRPLLVDRSLGNVLKALPSYPYGALFRVLPRGEPRPSIDDVAARNRDWFRALDLDYPPPAPDDEYPALIHEGYAATWQIIADAFAHDGRRDDAVQASEVARALGPRP